MKPKYDVYIRDGGKNKNIVTDLSDQEFRQLIADKLGECGVFVGIDREALKNMEEENKPNDRSTG